MAKKPEPIKPQPQAKPQAAPAPAPVAPKVIWTGNFCACGEPVAPGQSEVCIAHQRSR